MSKLLSAPEFIRPRGRPHLAVNRRFPGATSTTRRHTSIVSRLATRQGAVQVFDMSVPVQKTRGNRDFGVSADIVHRSDNSTPRGKVSKSLPLKPKKSPSLADIR